MDINIHYLLWSGGHCGKLVSLFHLALTYSMITSFFLYKVGFISIIYYRYFVIFPLVQSMYVDAGKCWFLFSLFTEISLNKSWRYLQKSKIYSEFYYIEYKIAPQTLSMKMGPSSLQRFISFNYSSFVFLPRIFQLFLHLKFH